MPWKLSLALALALAWLPSSSVRAEETADEPATEQAAEPEPAAPSEEPAQAEETEAEETAEADDAADDDEPVYDRDGWYLGIGAGYTKELFQDGNAGDGGYMQIRAGFHFLRFAALEAQLEYSPRFKGKSGDFDGVDVATLAAWLNMKGYPVAPWTGFIQPFGTISLGWMWGRFTGSAINNSVEEGGFGARFGGGVDFYITRNIVLTAEVAYLLPTGELDDLDQLQIGGAAQYRF